MESIQKKYNKQLTVVGMIVIILISVFAVTPYAVNPEHHEKTIESLDEKKATVLKLTATATGAATAIAAIPGDATTPVANKLADLSSYFMMVLMVVFLEKYLVTLTGYAAFQFLIPLACVLVIIGVMHGRKIWYILAGKIAVFAFIIALLIPCSTRIAGFIENTYDSSVEATLENAKETTAVIEENTDEDGNIITRAIKKLQGGISGLVKKGENLLNNFIEAIAVMLVTSCLIPVGVLLFAVWILQILFGVKVEMPEKAPRRIKDKRE